jgi:acetyl-CoA carboxylase biotin carboxyl carrier protein
MDNRNQKTIDIQSVENLIKLLNESHLSKIEIKQGDVHICITKEQTNQTTMAPNMSYIPYASPSNHSIDRTSTSPTPSTTPSSERLPKENALKSPMVGTFYSASSPEAKPFVIVGQSINKGDTIGIVEAMKMFNEIEADVSGTVTAILVNNGDPIEFGQPLLIIE